MKNLLIRLLALLGGLGLIMVLVGASRLYLQSDDSVLLPEPEEVQTDVSVAQKNGRYLIEGKTVILKDGVAERPISSTSTSIIITRYFGNSATGDLDGDDTLDSVFLLTQEGGGSGTFFYVAGLLSRTDVGGTNAVFLGDRIAPQSTEIRDGRIIVTYGDRKEGDPMTALPSVGVSRYFEIKEGSLREEIGGQ